METKEEENREKGFCDNLLEMDIKRDEALSVISFFIAYFEIKPDELNFED